MAFLSTGVRVLFRFSASRAIAGRRSTAAAVCGLIFFLIFTSPLPAQRRKSKETDKGTPYPQQLQPGPVGSSKAGPRGWIPPDIDEVTPPVAADVPCSLPDVLKPASERVKELVSNLEQFTAIERIEHSQFNSDGAPSRAQIVSYKYLVSIYEPRAGFLNVEETRDGQDLPATLPKNLATRGLAAFAFVFHPFYAGDFEMSCEGLGQWRGIPAWQIRFAQRPNMFHGFRTYQVGMRRYEVRLKGRAWIAADSFQVLRLESDLLEPLPEIKLQTEHLIIEYSPVDFPKRKLQLWLPKSAELYMDFRGARFFRRHSFSDFLLFAVDLHQRIEDPKEPPEPPLTD